MRPLSKVQIPLLWLCQFAFLLRVLGQIQVALVAPSWMPPMSEWYSGLIEYPLLLPTQILILMFMTVVSYDNTRKDGYFYVTSPRTKKILLILSAIYFAVMVARYGIQMTLQPETRWFGRSIPIFFHWVLAGYIFSTNAR